MEWKLSIWLSKEQKESARRPVLVIPINRDSCILEKNDLELTITTRCHETYDSSTWKLIFETEEKENQVKIAAPNNECSGLFRHRVTYFLFQNFCHILTLFFYLAKMVNRFNAACSRSPKMEDSCH